MLEIISSLAVFMTSDKVAIAGQALLEGFSLSQQLADQKLQSTWPVVQRILCLFLAPVSTCHQNLESELLIL